MWHMDHRSISCFQVVIDLTPRLDRLTPESGVPVSSGQSPFDNEFKLLNQESYLLDILSSITFYPSKNQNFLFLYFVE